MGYANPEVDRVLEDARRELDDERRAALYRKFNLIFHRDQPVTLLAHERAAVLLHKRFRRAEPGALGLVPELWWVAPAQQRYR
jgi:peptide/nickel transport system substrate-binding protein